MMRNGYSTLSAISDSTADRALLFAVLAWLVSCAFPPIGMLMQFPLIAYLVWKADIKGIPTLLLLVLGRNNLAFIDMQGQMALRLGITISPTACFAIVAFLSVTIRLVQNKYDRGTCLFVIFWALSIIPAIMMSYEAKINGLTGFWSGPIVDFLIPSIYLWGVAVARSYESGKDYFLKRLLLVLVMIETLRCIRIVKVFTFSVSGLIVSLFFYFVRSDRKFGYGWKIFSSIGIVVSLFVLAFGRKLDLIANGDVVASADEYGSTFSRMGVYALVLIFIFWFKHRSYLNRFLPILIVLANFFFVSYAINTQAGFERREVKFQYETMDERIAAKFFGDRANVWTMGWDEVKTPPYFIKDLRNFLVFSDKKGYGMKLLPHNQFLTLLGRDGWWLGLTLSLFIIWVWLRAMKALYYCMDDPLIYTVFVPTGLAVYAVVGTTGQSVVSADPWASSLTCIIMPAIIYGAWLERRKMGMFR